MRSFPKKIVEALHAGKILGIRAGKRPHRFIGIWVVVAENRVFVRSWTVKPEGWNMTFVKNPRGTIKIGNRNIPVRAIRVRSGRLKDAVSKAYGEKYHTPGSLKYVRGFRLQNRKDTTLELVPLEGFS